MRPAPPPLPFSPPLNIPSSPYQAVAQTVYATSASPCAAAAACAAAYVSLHGSRSGTAANIRTGGMAGGRSIGRAAGLGKGAGRGHGKGGGKERTPRLSEEEEYILRHGPIKPSTPEEIAAWIAERKKNWPSKENVARKAEAAAVREASGAADSYAPEGRGGWGAGRGGRGKGKGKGTGARSGKEGGRGGKGSLGDQHASSHAGLEGYEAKEGATIPTVETPDQRSAEMETDAEGTVLGALGALGSLYSDSEGEEGGSDALGEGGEHTSGLSAEAATAMATGSEEVGVAHDTLHPVEMQDENARGDAVWAEGEWGEEEEWIADNGDAPNENGYDDTAAGSDMRRAPKRPRTCFHFARGSCRFGERCHFSHDPHLVAELQEQQARKRQKGLGKAVAVARGGEGPIPARKPTLLQKLLAKEIRTERSLLLQCFRVMVRDMLPADDRDAVSTGPGESGPGESAPAAAMPTVEAITANSTTPSSDQLVVPVVQ